MTYTQHNTTYHSTLTSLQNGSSGFPVFLELCGRRALVSGWRVELRPERRLYLETLLLVGEFGWAERRELWWERDLLRETLVICEWGMTGIWARCGAC